MSAPIKHEYEFLEEPTEKFVKRRDNLDTFSDFVDFYEKEQI